MRTLRHLIAAVALSLLLIPVPLFAQAQGQTQTPAQEQPAETPTKGFIEFGVRGVFGDVYGRPDLQFEPALRTSKFNEYSDRRTGFYVRRASLWLDDVFGSNNYVTFDTSSSLYKNQSYLVSFGNYGKFRTQFRYDEIPHIYTNTTRTIFSETSPGRWTVPLALKNQLLTASSTGTSAQIALALPSFLATQVVCGQPIPPSTSPPACDASFITPQILRKNGAGSAYYKFTESWTISGLFSRENQVGNRPIGIIFNPSPSTSASSQPGTTSGRQSPGTGVEIPETIDYFTDNVNVMGEYGHSRFVVQFGYTGSFFENNVSTLFVDNPFATADVPVQLIAPGGGCTPTAPAVNCVISAIPARAEMDLYPNNKAHYLNFAGMFGLGKYFHVLGSVNPGWLSQNDPFLFTTSNTAITGLLPLPALSLDGEKRTLAMNWTLVGDFFDRLQLAAKYRHYDYNNHTEERTFEFVPGDVIGANSTATGQATPGTVESLPYGYNKKTLELSGNYFFGKRSRVKVGYEGEWFDREHRDVHASTEHSVFGSVDLSPWQDFLFRVALRHSDRTAHDYQDELAEVGGVLIPCSDTTTVAFTAVQRCSRRFDEADRIMDRLDVLLGYDWRGFSFTAGFNTMQADFNRQGGVNSATPLNFLTGASASTAPYFLYGLQNDLSRVWTAEVSYTFNPEVSLFAEYTREGYYKRLISRYRVPTSGVQTILTCNGCDTANNDWESPYSDLFDTYAAGFDFFLAKKIYLTTFYSLSDGKGRINSRFLGDPTILAPATTNRFLLVGTTAAVDYPQSNTRIHELAVVFKWKLTDKVMPKLEYRLQQFDNEDAQTSVMFPYMACISPATGTAVTGCPTRIISSTSSPTPTLSPNGATPFYPGFQVGDTAAARYLFLGVDQPSYRAHVLSGTLEFRW